MLGLDVESTAHAKLGPMHRDFRVRTVQFGTPDVGWVLRLALPDGLGTAAFVVLGIAEMAVPMWGEASGRTTWHPRHIAERYGLLVIITLGEVIIGTVASVNALVHGETGWSVEAALLAERLATLGSATFAALTADCAGPLEVVARFLAVLDLFRNAAVELEQPEAFGELTVRWTP